MYTVLDYGRMAADVVRMDAFQRAIAKTVRPGAVVLDLGAGTGIMSLLALRAGAARVHAVDPNPAIWLIPELAAENGVQGRIVVHQASSLEMTVPEKVDVVVSDMRGASPLLEENMAALRDVRARWLAPGGIVLPARDRLQVVLVEAEGMGARLAEGSRSFERLGFAAGAARRSVCNQTYSDSAAPLSLSDVLTTSGTWSSLDYEDPPTRSLEGTVTLDVRRGGIARGLCAYFETDLCDGVSYTTGPGHAIVYNRLYLPLLEEVRVEPEDRVTVTLRADVTGERWAWDSRIERAGRVLANQRQATFLGLPSSMESLVKGAETSAPRLGQRGVYVRDLLAAMDGTRTIKQIADEVSSGARIADPLELVRNLSLRYGA